MTLVDGQYIRECILDAIIDACGTVWDFCDEQGITLDELDEFLMGGENYFNC